MDEDSNLRSNPGHPFDLDRLFGPQSSPPLALPEISGTPAAAGTTTVTYTVTDSSGSEKQTFAIAVRDAVVRAVSGKDNCDEITPSDLAEITRPDVSGLSITSVTADDFDGFASLTYFDLSRNLLAILPDGVFSELGNLRELFLNSNRLTEIRTAVFGGLNKLKMVDISSGVMSMADEDSVSLIGRKQPGCRGFDGRFG